MSSAIGVGNSVPLVLDVGDFNDTLYVQAMVFQPNQSVISTFNLLPKGDGRYAHVGYLMPDFDYIMVKFITYEDSGYSIRAGYHDVTESFTKNDGSSSGGGDNSELIATINKAMNELRTVDITVDVIEEESIQAVFDYRDTPDTIEILVEEETEIVISVEQENEVSGTIVENEIIENIGE